MMASTFDASTTSTSPVARNALGIAVLGGVAIGALLPLLHHDLTTVVLAVPFVVAAVIDIRERRIPNTLTAATLVLALVAASLSGHGVVALLGATAALLAGVVLHVGARGAFGWGDVKLMAGAGAVLGVAHIPDFLIAMAFVGGAIALVALVSGRGRGATIPYGPAITIALLIVQYTGP